jgi:hypothetical protein
MDVKVDGVPVVGIQIGVNRFIEIPDKLNVSADFIEQEVIPRLARSSA